MPRKALVTKEEAVAVIEKFINHFVTTEMPGYSSPVWKEMSKDLDGKWSPHNVYSSVRTDRRGILSTARENLGVIIEVEEPQENIKKQILSELEENNDNDSDELFDDTKSLNNNDDMSDFELDDEVSGLSQFEVLITREEWQEMKAPPAMYKKRICTILKQGVWTPILALTVARQTKLPCAFIFKNSHISTASNSLHYLKIKGHCKSKTCQNQFFGYVDRDPGDNDFYMTVRTRDTINDDHEYVRRPVRKAEKQKLKRKCEEVIAGGTEAERKHAAKYVNIFMCRRCNYPNVIVPKKDQNETNNWSNNCS